MGTILFPSFFDRSISKLKTFSSFDFLFICLFLWFLYIIVQRWRTRPLDRSNSELLGLQDLKTFFYLFLLVKHYTNLDMPCLADCTNVRSSFKDFVVITPPTRPQVFSFGLDKFPRTKNSINQAAKLSMGQSFCLYYTMCVSLTDHQ